MRPNPEERIGSDSVKISMICFTENGHRIQERLTPRTIEERTPGRWRLDFGRVEPA